MESKRTRPGGVVVCGSQMEMEMMKWPCPMRNVEGSEDDDGYMMVVAEINADMVSKMAVVGK